jgi:hypothetical protein
VPNRRRLSGPEGPGSEPVRKTIWARACSLLGDHHFAVDQLSWECRREFPAEEGPAD